MPAMKVLVRHKGPLPQGEARPIIRKHMRAMKDDLGKVLVARVQSRLDTVLVHPTGHYRSQIDYLINQGNGAVIVHDRGVVYGPWLEGTGSRNRTTRFKGYATFRTITQQTQNEVEALTLNEVSMTVKDLS